MCIQTKPNHTWFSNCGTELKPNGIYFSLETKLKYPLICIYKYSLVLSLTSTLIMSVTLSLVYLVHIALQVRYEPYDFWYFEYITNMDIISEIIMNMLMMTRWQHKSLMATAKISPSHSYIYIVFVWPVEIKSAKMKSSGWGKHWSLRGARSL